MRIEDAIKARARSERGATAVVRHLMMPGHEVARAEPVAGERIGEFLRRIGWSRQEKFSDGKWRWTFRLPTACLVNGEYVLQRQWKRRRIKAGDSIIFLSRPLGGGEGGGGKQVLGLVALIAASALALWIPGAIGLAGTLAGTLVTAGITVGASLLINALIAPKAGGQADAGTAQDTAPQAFSLSAGGNSARALQTIPVSYGRLRKYCDFATLPWSEFIGDDAYLNVLLCEGGGKYQHEQVLIDDTILWDSVNGFNPDFDCIVGFFDPGQTVTLFPVNVTTAVEVSGQQLPPGSGSNPVNDLPAPTPGPFVGGFVANGPGTLADALALDFAFPAGCFVVNRDGDYFGRPVRLSADYRPVDDAGAPIGDWAQLFFTTVVYNTRKPQKFSVKVPVAPGRYEVRARRFGAEAADFDAKINGASGSDSLVWLQLRAYLQGNSGFAKESTVAIRIRATQISQGSARKFSVISTRIVPVWNGSNFVDQPTRNPLWAFLDAAINTDYGAKRPVGRVDFATIVDMASEADARGDTFDFEFRSPDQVPNAFDTILKATRARHRWSGDLLSAVRDQQRTVPQLLLTDREIVRGSLTVNWALNSEDQADAVLLEYLDQNIWGPAEVQYPPNSDAFTATNPARIRLDGVISRVLAQKHAAFFYRQALYRRTTITLDTEWEGKMLSYGSFVRVQSELPQSWGASGRIADYDAGVLTLDPPPSWAPEQTYIQIRTRRGGRFGPVKASRFGSDELALLNPGDLAAVEAAQGMTIATALARSSDEEDASFVLGTASATAKDCIVMQGRPSGDRVTLTLAVDDARVHNDDIAAPPDIPQAPALRDRAAPIIIMLQGNFRQGLVEPILDATWAPAASTFYYEAQISYDGGASWSQAYQGEQPSFSKVVDYASLQLRVRGVGIKKGAFNQISVEPPVITMRPDVIEIESFKAGLRDYVENFLTGQADDVSKALQFIASFTAEQEAHNWLQKNETHALLEVKSQQASASIEEVRTVAEGTDAALASFTATVSAHFDNLDASVTTNATAVATIGNKLAATWSVKLNVQGYISGIQSFNDGSTAGTIFVGDVFQVAFPGQNGGSPVQIFGIGQVNGAAKVALRGDMFVDGIITGTMVRTATLSAVHIAVGSITADRIQANSIDSSRIAINGVDILNIIAGAATAAVGVAGANTSVFDSAGVPQTVTMTSLGFVSKGGVLIIDGDFLLDSVASGSFVGAGINVTSFMSIWVDGIQVIERSIPPFFSGGASNNNWYFWAGPHISTAYQPGPGNHGIELKLRLQGQTNHLIAVQNIVLRCLESRR